MRAHLLGKLSGAIAVSSAPRAQPPIRYRSELMTTSRLGDSLLPPPSAARTPLAGIICDS